MKKIFVFGAYSALAFETLKHFNQDDTKLYLCGSTLSKLETIKADLLARTPNLEIFLKEVNALEFENHTKILTDAAYQMKGIDLVFIAHGTLPDQERTQNSVEETLHHFNINCNSIISLSTLAANYMEQQGFGTIAVISSVAGERGRKSNYIYGSAKGAVSLFLQGLRNRMYSKNVNVLTLKPGMVSTPMTAHMPKGALFADPKKVGKLIYKSILSKKDISYIPSFWRLIMFIIRSIPESIFKKLSL